MARMETVRNNENARSVVTASVTRGICRMLISMGYAPLTELTLVSGRRADIVGLNKSGHLILVEVKSCEDDFRSDMKWTDYLDFCDDFYFGVGQDFPHDALPEREGVIIADSYGGMIKRFAQGRKLTGARRKSMLLRLSRQAIMRQTSTQRADYQ